MSWATFETGSKFCVFLLDADNNKKGESLECFDTRPEAQNYVKGLYAKDKAWGEVEEAFKAGARHSFSDNDLIQKAHDAICELGAKCKEPERGLGAFENTDKLAIFKQADGRHRWLALSSSAFQDRDREIVSTKALENDVERADSDGNYGPLRFWHEPGVDLGTCDYNAMEGRVLIESGTFYDESLAERLKTYADEIELSIGFIHPPDEPDAGGVYHHIRRFERSLVERGMASNLLTQFVVNSKEHIMDEKKKSLLEKWIGPDLAARFIGQAKESQKVAEEAGLKFKETEAPPAEVKAEDKPADEKKPDFLTSDAAKEMINKAFAEYEARQSESKKVHDEATLKATSELGVTLKAIADGQVELKEAVTLALSGVAELKGELPRKLTDPREFYRPSQDGATPGNQMQQAVQQLLAQQKEFTGDGLDPSNPFAKFEQSIFSGVNNGQTPQQFVAPNAPKGS